MSTISASVTGQFLTTLHKQTGASAAQGVTRDDLAQAAVACGLPFPRWFANGDTFRLARGRFRIPSVEDCLAQDLGYPDAPAKRGRKPKAAGTLTLARPRRTSAPVPSAPTPTVQVADLVRDDSANTTLQTAVSEAFGADVVLGSSDQVPYVPAVDPLYVPWGCYDDLRTILQSGQFLPTMIVGPSGNGKSVTPEQICAQLGREFVRANITKDTDEDDLIGGFRLVQGDTKFALGPVPLAMLRGAVLNLDEIDLGGASLMCLQSILEGKPLYIKKIGRYISPAPGFSIVATSNTKGRGDDGRFMHTQVMNDAMLERFAVMFEQGWAPVAIERKIVSNHLKALDKYDAALTKHLVEFAHVTRRNFEEGNTSDQIATRRLLHLCRVYAALGSVERAMELTLARFDKETAGGFLTLWKAIHDDPTIASPSGAVEPVVVDPTADATV